VRLGSHLLSIAFATLLTAAGPLAAIPCTRFWAS